MANPPKIMAFAGSARRESFNKRLVRVAAKGAEAAGASVTYVDLADYPLPIFNQDLEAEQGAPALACQLKALMIEQDGFLIASPEYNSSLTGLLKNTIDWVSRASAGESPLAAFQGKAAVIMSASPGGLGGLRGLVHLRAILGNIGVLVHPDQIAISQAGNAFAADGSLQDEKQQSRVAGLGATLATFLQKLKAD